jgi:hypothetical protein
MYSYSVIQAHTLLVLLLASLFAIVCSYESAHMPGQRGPQNAVFW